MDVKKRINEYLSKNNWSINKLASEASLTQSTVYKIMGDEYVSPNLKTIEAVCNAFNITLGEFFSENVALSDDERLLLSYYSELKERDKNVVLQMTKNMRNM